MDTIRQIELMEKRWREAEASRHMERALELEKRKLRGGPTGPPPGATATAVASSFAELPRGSAAGLRASVLPVGPVRPMSVAVGATDHHARPVSMLTSQHYQPGGFSTALGSGQSAAAVIQSGPHHGVSGNGSTASSSGVHGGITDDVTLENAALRRQLQSVTQENLQLKKEISSASEEIARLMAKVDELSRQWAKSSPRVIRRPTTVVLTPRSIGSSDSSANSGPPPPSRLTRKVLLVDQKHRFSNQQIPVSVISNPPASSDEWRHSLKSRSRISMVPKLFTGSSSVSRKWKPPSLLEDEIDSLDDNWKLLFGHEVSHAKLQELEVVSNKLQMRLRDENLMFAGLERLLKSYEKIEDQAGVEKTNKELADRRAKIDLKTRVFEEMIDKKQEMLNALDSMPPPADTSDATTSSTESAHDGVDSEDGEETVEWVEWVDDEAEWVEQAGHVDDAAGEVLLHSSAPTPTQPKTVPVTGIVSALSTATAPSAFPAVASTQPFTSSSSPSSPQTPHRGAAAASGVGPLRITGLQHAQQRPTSPPPAGAAGSLLPRSPSAPVSPGRSPTQGSRPVSFAHFSSSSGLSTQQRIAASSQPTYAAAASAGPSTSTSATAKAPSLSTRSPSRSAGLAPPATPLPPVPAAAASAATTTTTGRSQSTRAASTFTPSSALAARSLKPAPPLKPASLNSSPSSSPYSSPSSSFTSIPLGPRPVLGSTSSSSSSLSSSPGGRLTPAGGSSPSSSSSSVLLRSKGPAPSPPGSGGARTPATTTPPGTGGARTPATAPIPIASGARSVGGPRTSAAPSPPVSGGATGATTTSVRPTPPVRAPATPGYGSAVVVYDFVPETQDELALTRGERVTLRERIDENWWEGEARGKIGIFPHTFLQVLSLPSSSPSSSTS